MKLLSQAFRFRCALVIAGTCFLGFQPVSQAQNQPPSSAVTLGSTPRFDLELRDTTVVETLKSIAQQAKLQIVVSDNVRGTLTRVTFRQVTPEEAFQKIARAANLEWLKLDSGVYVFAHKSKSVQPIKTQVFDLEVSDMTVKQIVDIIAQRSGAKIIIATGDAEGKLAYVSLRGVTVEQALDTITRLSGLSWAHLTQDGDYHIIGRATTFKPFQYHGRTNPGQN